MQFVRWFIISTPVLVGLVLVASAGVHSLFLGDPDAYRNSPLIAIELLLVVALCPTLALQPFVAVYAMWQRKWAELGAVVVSSVAAMGLWLVAMVLDEPTLVYIV